MKPTSRRMPDDRAGNLDSDVDRRRDARGLRRGRRDGRHGHGRRALSQVLRSEIRVHPLEPAESPTLSTGRKVGHHRIQGISDEFVPPIVKLDELDEIIAVHDGDAILMAQKLAHHGLAVGISSGANFVGALKAQAICGGDAPTVTIFCDSNKKYLSTDLLRREPVRPEYESPHVEILGYSAFSRTCAFCTR